MSYLGFIFRKHPPPKNWNMLEFDAKIGEALDTPIGTMTGAVLFSPRSLPNILLFPAKESLWYTAKSFKIKSGQSLKLEGDFNKYFEVYSIEGYEVFALELLSPEFMQSLMELDHKLIIYIALNEVYILLQEPQALTDKIEAELKNAASSLAKSLHRKLRNWSDQDAEESSKKMLDYSRDDTVWLKGRQLDYRVYVGLFFAVFINIIIWGAYLTSSYPPHTLANFGKTLALSSTILLGLPLYARYLIRK